MTNTRGFLKFSRQFVKKESEPKTPREDARPGVPADARGQLSGAKCRMNAHIDRRTTPDVRTVPTGAKYHARVPPTGAQYRTRTQRRSFTSRHFDSSTSSARNRVPWSFIVPRTKSRRLPLTEPRQLAIHRAAPRTVPADASRLTHQSGRLAVSVALRSVASCRSGASYNVIAHVHRAMPLRLVIQRHHHVPAPCRPDASYSANARPPHRAAPTYHTASAHRPALPCVIFLS